MGKKHRNLIGRIVADKNIRTAYNNASRGKRQTTGYLEFKEYAEANLAVLAKDIASGDYRMGEPRQFYIYEPKKRMITALPFRDRVAQHALVNVIGTIFEATLLPRTFACRKGKGTHAGVKAVQSDMRRLGTPLYVLKTDFAQYFHSIDRCILHRLIRKKISCDATLRLIEAITPRTGKGLPIGSLTSQLYANIYGGEVDRYLQCVLRERYWYRYMDDIVVLGADAGHLRDIKRRIEVFSAEELRLSLSRWSVASASRGVNFLGYRIWPTHKLLRRRSVIRARCQIQRYRKTGDHARLRMFIAAWGGHIKWADAHNLRLVLRREIRNASYHKHAI